MIGNLETVECNTGENPEYSVIWLHGLGADGHDFEPIVPELDLGGRSVRFVFPHAPVRPVTLNGGMPMRAWFDILSLDRQGRPDEQGIRTSAEQVAALIQRENDRGIPAERIVLAGFSQGGAIALHLGLRRPGGLAGIMALSTYLPLADSLQTEASPSAPGIPLFMAHGRQDPVLPFAWGQQSRDRLLAEGYAVQWHAYDMPHAVCAQEISDIGAWLRTVLPRS
ncbi:MAG: alpha/beta hydrolase [Gammaproteobacteria bacterium]|jgi:phospholipase/carboxylesterase|nr:alpha/beta hydrolase [Gammaproteobacteria bacterium]